MTISRAQFVDDILSLLWGVWTGIGISGWSKENFRLDFAVDLEAFILATSHFGESDKRLRQEVINWCIAFFPVIPKGRLKNLLAIQPEHVRSAFGRFAATVNMHSAARWPGASEPFRIKPKLAVHRDLRLPHLITLRLRGLFGSTARAEVIGLYSLNSNAWFSASEIARRIHYQKRSVADVLDNLAASGLLRSRKDANRLLFGLTDAQRLLNFVGDVPPHCPRWDHIFLILYEIETILDRHQSASPVAEVDVVRTLTDLEESLDAAQLASPAEQAPRPGVWEPFTKWASQLSSNLSRGELGDAEHSPVAGDAHLSRSG